MKNLLGIILLIVLGFIGYRYYINHQKEIGVLVDNAKDIKDNVIDVTNKDIDLVIKKSVEGVSSVSLPYYAQNRNYGTSATENICTSSNINLGGIIATIQKYTKSVSCVADTDYPSRSFTIVAPSKINKNTFYCTDQSGFSTITSISSGSTFREGIKCK